MSLPDDITINSQDNWWTVASASYGIAGSGDSEQEALEAFDLALYSYRLNYGDTGVGSVQVSHNLDLAKELS